MLEASGGELVTRLDGVLAASPPILSGGAVLYASRYGLIVHDLATGRSRRWLAAAGWGQISSPVVAAGGRLHFATEKVGFICAGPAR